MTTVVVSPHLDDAVFSLGRLLARLTDPLVVTVFDGVPDACVSTPYDEGGGFDCSVDAVRARIVENDAALAVLGCTGAGLGLLDGQYRSEACDPGEIVTRLVVALEAIPQVDEVLVPVGIHHPDHEAAAEAGAILDGHGWPVAWYEELPYRVWFPIQTIWLGVALTIEDGPRDTKAAAVACYASQLNDEITDCLYVPERVWRRA